MTEEITTNYDKNNVKYLEKEFKLVDKKIQTSKLGREGFHFSYDEEDIKECFRLLKESPDFDDEDKAFFNKLTGFSDEEMKK